jgi:hypothetical protein
MIRYLCKSYLPYPWMIRRKVFHPSLDRLAALSEVDARDAKALNDASLEFSRILQNLRLRGIWKWTGPRRLRRMDRLLSDYASARALKSLRMLDLGASDGSTTLDTVEYLQQNTGISVQPTILDLDTRLLAIRRGSFLLYATPSGRPVLARRGKLALCLEPMEGIEGLLFNRLAAALARRCARGLEPADLAGAGVISLLNPAAARCPFIDVREGNLFEAEPEWFGRFDAVRASNVLNFSYFTAARIGEALGLAHRYLKEGGALLVSRNIIHERDETETGGLWTKEGPRFVRQAGLDQLPDIADLVDGFRSF